MSNFTAAQAKVSDAKLAELTNEYYAAADAEARIAANLHFYAGDKSIGRGQAAHWGMSDSEALAIVEAKIENDEFNPNRDSQQRTVDAYLAAGFQVVRTNAAVEEHNMEWLDNGQWSRFFVVQDGHIHSSTRCHSLRPTTRVGWLPALSGESEKDAVDAHGSVLCTHCFKSAPVEWTTKAPKKADPSICAGSGKYVPGVNMARVSKYGKCPECGENVSVTSLSNARKHKASVKV